MNIRKVKLKDGRITVIGEELTGEDDLRRVSIESREEARPGFYSAFEALLAPALSLIEAPEKWRTESRVSGLSVNEEEDGRLGAVVTLLIDLEATNSPLVVNTPHCREFMDDEGGKFMPADLLAAVEAMIDEAKRYLDGERAQAGLFDGPREAAAEMDATMRRHGATGKLIGPEGEVVATFGRERADA